MNIILVEIGILVALLLLNAVFSMSEMAGVSSRKARLQQLAVHGNKGAEEALRLAESPSRFLSTIQIGITLVGVLSGAFGGATLSEELGHAFVAAFAWDPDVAEAVGVGIVVTVISVFSVILGELVPKQVALKSPERIASLAARPMSALSRFSAPVVWFLSAATDLVLRVLRLDKTTADNNVTHEEIKAMVQQGAQDGVLEDQEKDMVDRVLSFGKQKVVSLMTPTYDVLWVDVRKPLSDQLKMILDSRFSHYPVADGSLDHLLGTVQAKDICRVLAEGSQDLQAVVAQPVFIPESSNALQVLELFKRTGLSMGFVIDEFGAIQGILTLTNLVEAILGDLPSHGSPQGAAMVQRADGSWLVEGSLLISHLKEKLGFESMDGEKDNLFQTVAGFAMYKLGRVPSESDVFVWQEWRFEIIDMDRNRVDKIMISRHTGPSATSVLLAEKPRVRSRQNPKPAEFTAGFIQ